VVRCEGPCQSAKLISTVANKDNPLATSDRKEWIMARKLTLILLSLSLATPVVFLSGCNTMAGAGSDVSAAGAKLHDEAREHQHY
jgi:predicted small secreted protein